MLTITDQAIREFKSIIQEMDAAEAGISISLREGSCCQGPSVSMALTATPDPSFAIHDFQGLKVFLQPGAAQELSGAVLDYFPHAENPAFRIQWPEDSRPNNCGCH